MFGSLLRIGSKLLGGMRIGSKFIKGAGRLGTKVAAAGNKAINMATGLPIVGHAIGASPIVQGLRGVVGGLENVSQATTAAGDVLEKGASALGAGGGGASGPALAGAFMSGKKAYGQYQQGRKQMKQGKKSTKIAYLMDKAKLKGLFSQGKTPSSGTRHF